MGFLPPRIFAIVALFLARAMSDPLGLLAQAHGVSLIQMRAAAVSEKAFDNALHSDLSRANVTHNYLGGVGPGAGDPTLVFEDVGIGWAGNVSFPIHMVVANTSTYEANLPKAAGKNGRTGGLGIINVKCDTWVDLEFKFINGDTNQPVYVADLFFSSLDLDSGSDVHEHVDFEPGIVAYYVSSGTHLNHTEASGGHRWQSTSESGVGNNPTSALNLTSSQKALTVTTRFQNRSTIRLQVGAVPGGSTSCKKNTGRNFMFGFESNLMCTAKNVTDAWTVTECMDGCNPAEGNSCDSSCRQMCEGSCRCNEGGLAPSASGDPHMINVLGEHFNLGRVGEVELLKTPGQWD